MPAKKYKKKPVEIDAIQFVAKGNDNNGDEVCIWANQGKQPTDPHLWHNGTFVFVQTLEGTMTATLNDWIIKGVKGEFYPCKPDIFLSTYDGVS